MEKLEQKKEAAIFFSQDEMKFPMMFLAILLSGVIVYFRRGCPPGSWPGNIILGFNYE
jgi:hypothetical protein